MYEDMKSLMDNAYQRSHPIQPDPRDAEIAGLRLELRAALVSEETILAAEAETRAENAELRLALGLSPHPR
jgi:hypothetical protein